MVVLGGSWWFLLILFVFCLSVIFGDFLRFFVVLGGFSRFLLFLGSYWWWEGGFCWLFVVTCDYCCFLGILVFFGVFLLDLGCFWLAPPVEAEAKLHR